MSINPIRQFNIILLRIRSLFARGSVEYELDRELTFHLEQQIDENISRGMMPDEARLAALRSLGGVAQIQEECRDMRNTNLIETIWSDLRYAVRFLARTPAFTLVLVMTIALSIGANTAIFSVFEGVLLRPLPFAQPDRIVRIFLKSDKYPKFPLNPFDLRDYRERNKTFEMIAGITRHDVQLSGSGTPVMLHSFAISSGYFRVLGFSPALGREFTIDDEQKDRGQLAILSDRLWRETFAADPNIVGRGIVLNSVSYEVVGVMPPGVQHPGNDYHSVADGDTVDLWCPFTYEGNPNQRGSHFLEGIGRLKPGVTPAQANDDLSGILGQLANEHPADKGWQLYLVPLYREMVGRTQRLLLVLLGAVGLLLLIACVNAANLLLARAHARQREIAVRAALGAGRGRIVRQLLTESLLIAIVGAILGGLLAIEGVHALVALLPPGFPRASSIHLDPLVFAFTTVVALVTGLLFGIVPALAASRTDLQMTLRESGRGSTGSRRQLRLRNLLVVGETGLACVLLIAAGLMLHSFVNLLWTDSGFRAKRVMTASISLPFTQYKKNEDSNRFYDQLNTKLSELPGVEAAGIGTDLPWTGYNENVGGFNVEGRDQAFNDKTTARYHSATMDYFRAIGIPLLEGRFFSTHDDAKAPLVIIVNSTFARNYWPNEDAMGKRIAFDDNPKESDWFQIVGIVGDVKDQADSKDAHPGIWWNVSQMPFGSQSMAIVMRAKGDPAGLANQLRQTIKELNPDLAVADIKLMDAIADDSVSSHRFALFLVGLFAALALILATIGMYGVISYSVSQRMHEFGVRMALGARRRDLMRLILGQGIKLAVIGSALGLLSAVAFSRLLSSLLYGVSGADPMTFGAVAALALSTAIFACYLPARRATQADPSRSLRAE